MARPNIKSCNRRWSVMLDVKEEEEEEEEEELTSSLSF
jgi:hypothetical protein